MNKLFYYLLLFLVSCGFHNDLHAQVTIGAGTAPQKFSVLEIVSNSSGGIRLPHLTTAERNALSITPEFQAEMGRIVIDPVSGARPGYTLGLTIYNTDTECIEYWDGYKWVSLCLGTADIDIENENGTVIDPTVQMFPVEGGTKGAFFPIANPKCESAVKNPPYTLTLMTGSEYTSIDLIDPSTGKFNVSMSFNPTAAERTAILRVADNCTGEYKEFVFVQAGDNATCGNTVVPDIKSNSSTQLCQNGAIYLYLDGYPSTGTYIWTLNGKEVGTGNYIAVTEPGKYIVYGDVIGCPNNKDITITRNNTISPSPVDFIVVGNNGVACGANGEVELVVSTTAIGDVVWFKNGVIQTSKVGTSIQADKGDWFAVVKNGDCTSRPTNTVTVLENTDGGNIEAPTMKINGTLGSWSFCKGGSMYLEVETPQPNVKYTWYINNYEIGTGSGLYHVIPSSDNFVLRLRATGSGCAKEALSIQNVSSSDAPRASLITTNTGDMLCGGETTLTASGSTGATQYRWFKDGVEYALTNTPSIKVTNTGIYTVSGINGGCVGIQSAPKEIKASDFATLSWVSHPDKANIGDTKTFSATLDFTQGASYEWDVTGGIITNGQGTSSVTVRFDAATTATVQCSAKNACGIASSSPLVQSVDVSPLCSDAKITSNSNLNIRARVNSPVQMNVLASGTSLTYIWYSGTKGTTAVEVGRGSTYTVTNNTIGTYLYWCRVIASAPCDTNPADSDQFTVEVIADPETVPTGTGTFTGKTCFDIAEGNNNSESCGALSSRASQKTDFTDTRKQDPTMGNITLPYSGVQVYTFKPTGTVSNVRFEYNDDSGLVIESVIPEANYLGGNISSDCKVVVTYKATLNTTLKGTTRTTGITAELYVVYNNGPNDNGTDQKLKLNLTFQDCACCGAKTGSGGWLTFMCHNLGADETKDPFTYLVGNNDGSGGTTGWLYQWGRPTDGHQKRNSPTLAILSNTDIPGNGSFIVVRNASPYNWRSANVTNLWGNGLQNENVPKGPNDPCPAGWKVPSQKQWASIFINSNSTSGAPTSATANTWTWTGNGYKIGDALFLPAAGTRFNDNGGLYYQGTTGLYWSSTVGTMDSYQIFFNTTTVNLKYGIGRATGNSVRCVAE